jgi:hypothetical protein
MKKILVFILLLIPFVLSSMAIVFWDFQGTVVDKYVDTVIVDTPFGRCVLSSTEDLIGSLVEGETYIFITERKHIMKAIKI